MKALVLLMQSPLTYLWVWITFRRYLWITHSLLQREKEKQSIMPSIDKSKSGRLTATLTPVSRLGQTQRSAYVMFYCMVTTQTKVSDVFHVQPMLAANFVLLSSLSPFPLTLTPGVPRPYIDTHRAGGSVRCHDSRDEHPAHRTVPWHPP